MSTKLRAIHLEGGGEIVALGHNLYRLVVAVPAQIATLDAAADGPALAAHLSKNESSACRTEYMAASQILRIQDRIEALGYSIDAGEPNEEEEAEQGALMISLAAWKAYKFALGKVTKQPTWPAKPVCPPEPLMADLEAHISIMM